MLWRQVVSHSPVDAADFDSARSNESAYRQSLAQLNQLLREGGTLSGHEANCAFLNTRGGPFATVSAVAGFDSVDDGRGLALVDWDADGDLDVWTSNRTGPRLRFLRNDLPTQNHFVAFRLEGRTCNRDAIGARLEVTSAGTAHGRAIKSLRAGEGFLSQSSKWVLFGLGDQAEELRVTVRWPDGTLQQFADLEPDRHYQLVQGQAEAIPWQRRHALLRIHPGNNDEPSVSDPPRIVLTQRIPMPRLTVKTNRVVDHFQNAAGPAASPRRPLLLNLWASNCAPCLRELQEWTQHAAELQAASLDLVALNVDGLMSGQGETTQDAKAILAQMEFPFAFGNADDELVQRLRAINELPFDSPVDLPVPTSFLIDPEWRVAVIYRGSIAVDRLLADVSNLALSNDGWRQYALPLPGRWNQPPQSVLPLRMIRELVDRRQLDDALEYVTRFQEEFAANPEFADLLVWLGDELVAAGQMPAGIRQYEAALKVDPQNLLAMNNFAWQLATHPDDQVRNGQLAVRWAQAATTQSQARDPGVLDTLAASYAEAGRFDDAIKASQRAIALVDPTQSPELIARMQGRLRGYQQKQPFRHRP